jgi:hypothetical protein
VLAIPVLAILAEEAESEATVSLWAVEVLLDLSALYDVGGCDDLVLDLRTLFTGEATSSEWSPARGRELRDEFSPRLRFLVSNSSPAFACVSTNGDEATPDELEFILFFLLLLVGCTGCSSLPASETSLEVTLSLEASTGDEEPDREPAFSPLSKFTFVVGCGCLAEPGSKLVETFFVDIPLVRGFEFRLGGTLAFDVDSVSESSKCFWTYIRIGCMLVSIWGSTNTSGLEVHLSSTPSQLVIYSKHRSQSRGLDSERERRLFEGSFKQCSE